MSTNGAAAWTNRITLETLTSSTITALSTLTVGSSFFTTTTNYTHEGESITSSMLIVIGQSLWKIPVEFVSTLN
jgi:hypothetical protein